MTFRAMTIVLLLSFMGAGCIAMDGFVWEPLPISDQNADLMAASQIPAQYRQEERISESDGTVVDAYLLSHDASDGTPVERQKIALIYCHGQDTNIETTVPRLDVLWQQGYVVLAFDYRGYGKTLGTPTDQGVVNDGLAAYDWVAAKAAQNGWKQGVYARSLGTAICLQVAVQRSSPALVLESPISSLQQIIDDSLGLDMPSDYFLDSNLNNLTEIPSYTGDLLIMHGLADTYVQPKYGEELHSLAQGHAAVNSLWLVPGANHDTVPCTSKAAPPIDNDCVGGLAGFSSQYFDEVNDLYGMLISQVGG